MAKHQFILKEVGSIPLIPLEFIKIVGKSMNKNEIVIVKVYKEKQTNENIYVDIRTTKGLDRISVRKLYNLKKRGYIITNAVLYKNNVIRGKNQFLTFSVIDTTEVKGLESYRNKKKYDGNTDKFGITWTDGNDYIVKYEKEKGDTSIYSEYVASNFMRKLGYNAHETLLYKDTNGIVVLLKDFTHKGEYLRSFKDGQQSSYGTELEDKQYTYKDVLYLISKHTKLSTNEKKKAIQQFWDMYMLDAILANRDRHPGNWGYICSNKSYYIAPIYDNGSSLFPDVSANLPSYQRDRKKFLEERCERFPASLLCVYSSKMGRNRRTNYYEVVGQSGIYKEQDIAYLKIKSFGIEKIYTIIKEICNNKYIDKVLAQFYIDIVCIRYMHIILRMSFEESYKELIRLCHI